MHCGLIGLGTTMPSVQGEIEILYACSLLDCCVACSLKARSLRQQFHLNLFFSNSNFTLTCDEICDVYKCMFVCFCILYVFNCKETFSGNQKRRKHLLVGAPLTLRALFGQKRACDASYCIL